MKIVTGIIVVVVLIGALVYYSGAIYTVPETKMAVITQFGKPVGKSITTAGLHFKKPFIQKVHYFDKRLMEWDGDPNQIPTKDKKYIWVDATARWKINDPLKFLQTVNNEQGAHSRLDDIINSATRDTITSHLLVEAVRDSNRIVLENKKDEDSGDKVKTDAALESISTGREQLEKMILKKAVKLAPKYGIELVDVRIKRLNYVAGVREKVYDRMIAERNRAAEKYRSEGQGRKAEIDGRREKELKSITSNAYRKAQGIKGKADSQVTKIYADAYSKDPKFYSFQKTHETYRKSIDKDTVLILTTDNDYYKHLKGSQTE
ncbi:MAG: protease modulator HflC [bacterium]|nr:protease modulator HflC [bacterium]